MLCYNGLGDDAKAEAHKLRYLRFKADESAQAITGPYRQKHPEDNNERQAIHEHVSVPLRDLRQATASPAGTGKNHVGTGALTRPVERSSTYPAKNSITRESK